MRARIAIAALILALSTFAFSPAMAQGTLRDDAVSACSVSPVDADACSAALELYIASLDGLPPREKDDLLADLVVELANAAAPETRAIIGTAIKAVASAMDNDRRADAAIKVADNVTVGAETDEDTTNALASPN